MFVLAVRAAPDAAPVRRVGHGGRRRGRRRSRSPSSPRHWRGTAPGELWDAVVVFRQEAASVIASSATASTTTRLGGMVLALVATGVPLLVVALARRVARLGAAVAGAGGARVGDLRGARRRQLLAALPDGAGARPGAADRGSRSAGVDRLLRAAYVVCAASTAVALGWVLVHPIERPEEPAIAWLDDARAARATPPWSPSAAPTSCARPGCDSPYPDLWSLPVRVHDPDLDDLTALLGGLGPADLAGGRRRLAGHLGRRRHRRRPAARRALRSRHDSRRLDHLPRGRRVTRRTAMTAYVVVLLVWCCSSASRTTRPG